MTAATATTPTAPAWVAPVARALGVELGRLVTVLAADIVHLAWFTGRLIVALDLILGWTVRIVLGIGWALISAVIYAFEDHTGRKQMRRRFHRRHTTTTKPRHHMTTKTTRRTK